MCWAATSAGCRGQPSNGSITAFAAAPGTAKSTASPPATAPPPCPISKRSITEHASALRLSWKNHGAYEAELIRRVDRRLAGYRSIYGHDFARPPPLSRRLPDYATYLRPPWLRRYTYRIKYAAGDRAIGRAIWRQPYREAVLPGGADSAEPVVSRSSGSGTPAQFARILSLEYALRQLGARVTADF